MLSEQPVLLFVDIILFVISFVLLVPIAVLFIECISALLPDRSRSLVAAKFRPKTAILVPAHNEESVIATTLENLLPQLTTQDQLIVIADNCTDQTAEIAHRYGATVIERRDLERRGKGYALDYGLRLIEADPPEVVVLIDADCIVQEGTVERIAQLAFTTGRPVQSTYLMAQPANPGPKDSVSALAFMVKNLVRPSGLARMGLPSLLTGTGMAFPWSVICTAPLASSNLVEDMQLGLDLAIAGHAPLFCQEAKVIGLLPQERQAAKGQRTRWEHGHLNTLLTQAPRLFKASIDKKRLDLLAIALDICIPPISLLVMFWVVVMGGALLAGALGATWKPALLLAIAGVMILVSVIGAWAKFGREDLPLKALLAAPAYMLWKIPLYLTFLVRPQKEWVRTQRDKIQRDKIQSDTVDVR